MPFAIGYTPWNKNLTGYVNSGSFVKGKKNPLVSISNQKRVGIKAAHWKGDGVGYVGIHKWVDKILGSPKKCDNCGTIKAKRYEWHNISGDYLRNAIDWIRLCRKCHYAIDYGERRIRKF